MMRFRPPIRTIALIGVVSTAACQPKGEAAAAVADSTRATTVASPPIAATIDSSLMVMLERGACRGRCPVYRVELYGNGKIQFDGKKFVDSLGIHTGTTSGASVRSLLATINTSDFGTMDTSYVMGSAACGSYMPDLPMSTVSAKIGATMKTVHYDPGCKNAPRSVQTLQKLIDSVAHTSAWTAVTGDSKK